MSMGKINYVCYLVTVLKLVPRCLYKHRAYIIIIIHCSVHDSSLPMHTRSRKSSTSSETGSSTSACSSNLSGTLDERDSTRHPTSAQSSHVSSESCPVSVITQWPSALSSRSSNTPVVIQGPPPQEDVITIQHGFASSPQQQDLYDDSYNVIPSELL